MKKIITVAICTFILSTSIVFATCTKEEKQAKFTEIQNLFKGMQQDQAKVIKFAGELQKFPEFANPNAMANTSNDEQCELLDKMLAAIKSIK